MKSRLMCHVFKTATLLILTLVSMKLDAQISPSAPTREYIRLTDRVIAIEQKPG